MDKLHPVIIIGAGIAGLSAAQRLAAANFPVLVLDKGRGVGGRMATRRTGEATFDHGAQYFSAKTPDFQRIVIEASRRGAVREWWPNISENRHPRWIGAEGMNDFPKFLSENLMVLKEKKVTQIQAHTGEWHVITEELDLFQASAVLVTIPAPQALELLKKSVTHLPEFSLTPLQQISYHPCIALLATLNRPSNIPPPGGLQTNGAVVSWLADNFQKGISKLPSVTIHASPDFSRTHLEGDLQLAARLMLEVVADFIPPASVLDWQIHRWRYALAFERHSAPFFQTDTHLPLLFGGDGFGIGNVEGAFLSGLAMAEQIIMWRMSNDIFSRNVIA